MCVCVIGHRYVGYFRIMRWWSSNLGQWPLHNLGSVAYCYLFILDPPRPVFPPSNVLLGGGRTLLPQYPSTDVHRFSAQYHPPNLVSPVSVPVYRCSWPSPYPFLSVLSPSNPLFLLPRLPDSRRSCTLVTYKIFSTVPFRWLSTATCLHHCTLSLPPPSYPVSIAHTSKICRRATNSETVPCLLSKWIYIGCVSTPWSIFLAEALTWLPVAGKPYELPLTYATLVPIATTSPLQIIAPPEVPHDKTFPRRPATPPSSVETSKSTPTLSWCNGKRRSRDARGIKAARAWKL